jgi:hypothetical protein
MDRRRLILLTPTSKLRHFERLKRDRTTHQWQHPIASSASTGPPAFCTMSVKRYWMPGAPTTAVVN